MKPFRKLIPTLLCLWLFTQANYTVLAYPALNIDTLIRQCKPLAVEQTPELTQAFQNAMENQTLTGKTLGMSDVYLQTIKDTFAKHQIPEQVAYLAASLSAYNNWNISSEGGSGFWQMRYINAKQYGLKINSYIDERRDFNKALHATAKRLTNLFKEFENWDMAVCAFYAGSVEVSKAIRKTSDAKSYWSIHPFLPIRYQKTVPNLLATIYIHLNQKELKIPKSIFSLKTYELVPITQWSTIYQISKALNIDYDDLKNLNPTFKKQIIPFAKASYYLKIPTLTVNRFFDLGDSVYTFSNNTSVGIEPEKIELAQVVKIPQPKSTGNTKLLYYTIRSGDYLGKVADLYDVRVSDLRRWNAIRGDKISVNQRLKIYKPSGQYQKYKSINGLTAAQKTRVINKD